MLLCSRGFVFGLWSACASVGNILGAFLASSMLKYGYEVRQTHTHTHTHTHTNFIDTVYHNTLNLNLMWCSVCCCVQYAFLVTSVVQFAGGVVVFFGLLTSPKEVGKDMKQT